MQDNEEKYIYSALVVAICIGLCMAIILLAMVVKL